MELVAAKMALYCTNLPTGCLDGREALAGHHSDHFFGAVLICRSGSRNIKLSNTLSKTRGEINE